MPGRKKGARKAAAQPKPAAEPKPIGTKLTFKDIQKLKVPGLKLLAQAANHPLAIWTHPNTTKANFINTDKEDKLKIKWENIFLNSSSCSPLELAVVDLIHNGTERTGVMSFPDDVKRAYAHLQQELATAPAVMPQHPLGEGDATRDGALSTHRDDATTPAGDAEAVHIGSDHEPGAATTEEEATVPGLPRDDVRMADVNGPCYSETRASVENGQDRQNSFAEQQGIQGATLPQASHRTEFGWDVEQRYDDGGNTRWVAQAFVSMPHGGDNYTWWFNDGQRWLPLEEGVEPARSQEDAQELIKLGGRLVEIPENAHTEDAFFSTLETNRRQPNDSMGAQASTFDGVSAFPNTGPIWSGVAQMPQCTTSGTMEAMGGGTEVAMEVDNQGLPPFHYLQYINPQTLTAVPAVSEAGGAAVPEGEEQGNPPGNNTFLQDIDVKLLVILPIFDNPQEPSVTIHVELHDCRSESKKQLDQIPVLQGVIHVQAPLTPTIFYGLAHQAFVFGPMLWYALKAHFELEGRDLRTILPLTLSLVTGLITNSESRPLVTLERGDAEMADNEATFAANEAMRNLDAATRAYLEKLKCDGIQPRIFDELAALTTPVTCSVNSGIGVAFVVCLAVSDPLTVPDPPPRRSANNHAATDWFVKYWSEDAGSREVWAITQKVNKNSFPDLKEYMQVCPVVAKILSYASISAMEKVLWSSDADATALQGAHLNKKRIHKELIGAGGTWISDLTLLNDLLRLKDKKGNETFSAHVESILAETPRKRVGISTMFQKLLMAPPLDYTVPDKFKKKSSTGKGAKPVGKTTEQEEMDL
ncbi:hypothetical protein BDZ89DRAFT_1140425 [Hymenopellis radicata]|nr:hypothetical protein BDZ89DRAFT_1140425 [Hymenopellis radicata]